MVHMYKQLSLFLLIKNKLISLCVDHYFSKSFRKI